MMFSVVATIITSHVLCFLLELLSEIEQVILEEFYEIEIEMFFKWRERNQPLEIQSYSPDKEEEDV